MTDTPNTDLGPRRLRDDPDFRWETGCDLSDEALVATGYDLPRGRARLLAAVAAAPLAAHAPPGPGPAAARWPAWLKPLAGLAGGVALLGGGYWLGTQAPRGAPLDPPIVEAPARPTFGTVADPAVAPATAGPTAPEAPPGIPVPPIGRAPEPPARAAERPTAAPADPPGVVVEGDGARIEVVGDVIVEGGDPQDGQDALGALGSEEAADPAPTSTLAAEMAGFDRIDEALARGDAAGAASAADAYLAAWPSGRLATEARFKRLLAVLATGDAGAAERQAADLQDRPEFASRRSEILRVRAESLVSLGRCGEALAMAGLSSKDAAEVRRACRRRETP